MNEQVLIGAATALLCGVGLWRDRWLMEHSRNAHRLAELLGLRRARWLLRSLLVAGLLFGCLLAAEVIRPLHG